MISLVEIYKSILNENVLTDSDKREIADAITEHIYQAYGEPNYNYDNELEKVVLKYNLKSKSGILYRLILVPTKLLQLGNTNDILYRPKYKYTSWSRNLDSVKSMLDADWFVLSHNNGSWSHSKSKTGIILNSNTEKVLLDIFDWVLKNEKYFEQNAIKSAKEEYEVVCKSRPIMRSDVYLFYNMKTERWEALQ